MVKKIILFVLLILCFMGCNKFDKQNFIQDSFGKNIEELSAGKKTYYRDGFLEIYGVSQKDVIYNEFFNQKQVFTISEIVFIEGESVKYEANPNKKIYYSDVGGFDGYRKVVLYIPKEEKMVFIYSTGII